MLWVNAFIMEMPELHPPSVHLTLQKMWDCRDHGLYMVGNAHF